MEKQDLLDNLAFLYNKQEEIGAELYFVLNGSQKEIKCADIDQELIPVIRNQFKNEIESLFFQLDSYSLMSIKEADDDRANTYYFASENEIKNIVTGLKDEIKSSENAEKNIVGRQQSEIALKKDYVPLSIISNVHNDEKASDNKFSFGKDDISRLFGFIIKIGNDRNKITLFKKHYPVSLMKRGAVLRIIPFGDRFKQIDNNIINLNQKFEFVFVNNELIVLNLPVLEKYFGYGDTIVNKAQENIKILADYDLVDDISTLNILVSIPKMAKKIMRLNTESLVLNIPKDKIFDFIRSYPRLKNIRFNKDGTKIKLVSQADTIAFIKLLEDDFLRSELTKIYYESLSKDALVE